MAEEDIDEMFGESDTNKDGKIDFDGKTEQHKLLWTFGSRIVINCQILSISQILIFLSFF